MNVHVELHPGEEMRSAMYYPELERLIGNAVCDPGFAEALLRDPLHALHSAGYEARLSAQERVMVGSVQGARSLREFAAALYQRLSDTPGKEYYPC